MWIPLLLIGAFFAARAASSKPRLALSAPMVSPLMMLDGFIRTNQAPPPQLLLSALAEAEQLHRDDIALAIVRKYIAPIVYRYELAHASDANAPGVPAQSPPLLMQPTSTMLSDEEIEAAMNADPSRFLATGQPPPSPAPPPPIDVPAASPPSAVTRPPIDDVGELKWSAFCDRLARETPLYVGKRHVGQYRASNTRLREIGVDPSSIVGSADRQRDALDREMADSWRHANAGGIVDEYGGRLIRLPGGGEATVSRSGILGIIQAAGLEGAVSWFEKPEDRQRYPNTTEVFLKTNGVF